MLVSCSKNIRKIEQPKPIIKVQHKGQILTLPLEEYVASVLAGEVSQSWPLEALKAQAIAARTFSLKKMKERASSPFHVESSVMDQVFRHHNQEIFLKAAEETKGLIVTLNGQIAETSFHSTCGGHTASAQSVWGTKHDHLLGVTCGFCQKSPTFTWKYEIKMAELEKIFGFKIKGIKLLDRKKDGRIGSINFISDKAHKLSGHQFRMKVGPMKIKSTHITQASLEKEKAIFKGKGFGHGVGLCQYGALGMAEQGFKAQEIVGHYYPQTKIKKIY